MLKPYVHLMQRPGAGAFFAAGILGRMPISMLGLGTVILIARESGSYGLAGAVSGVAVVAGALTGPIQGRLVDRWGQRLLLLTGSVVCTLALFALLIAVRADAPVWLLYVVSFVAGGTRPQVGSFVRARWTHLLGRGRALQTAFALEAVGDEVVFIVGPVLVTALATQVSPYVALIVAGVLGLVGTLWLAALRGSDPPGRGANNGEERAPLPGSRCSCSASSASVSAPRWVARRSSRSRSPTNSASPGCRASYWPSGPLAACSPVFGTARCTGAPRSNAAC